MKSDQANAFCDIHGFFKDCIYVSFYVIIVRSLGWNYAQRARIMFENSFKLGMRKKLNMKVSRSCQLGV